jgi:hypothetical protein
MATGTGAAQTQQNRTTQNSQQRATSGQRHTFNITLPGNWGYQEYAAINWIAGQLSQISSQYLVGFSVGMSGGFTMGGGSSGMSGQNSAVNGETTAGNQPERRGRRKMTPTQRAAHAERMRALAVRRKQERAATAQQQPPQKTKGKAAAAGAG